MPGPRHHETTERAAEGLASVAPLLGRWVERVLGAHDPPLTPTQYLVLRAVAAGDVVGADLARRAAVSPAAVSQLLTALEEAGFLQRLRTADDRRRQPVALSEYGSGVLRAADTALRAGLSGLLEPLPRPEIDALARGLAGVEAVLSGQAPPPRPRRPRPPGRG